MAATAVMLCLADRVETRQGDPRDELSDVPARRKIISYGNRLFCDNHSGQLFHRWGSAKLYRAYFQDYRTFLSRPDKVARDIIPPNGRRILMVHSDLSNFYDRVRPSLLTRKINDLAIQDDDPHFFDFAKRLFEWEWHPDDLEEVSEYAKDLKITGFDSVALPQGLVASGFFANLVLLDFDDSLRSAVRTDIADGIQLEDVSRYVDDLRIVVSVDSDMLLTEAKDTIFKWLNSKLDEHANGLQLSESKTKVTTFGDDERPLVRQSRKMERIQGTASGGFDAKVGGEILDAIQGLIRSQRRHSAESDDEPWWKFSPTPDVRDATVDRFAAARFRTTYRSLRPLLSDADKNLSQDQEDDEDTATVDPPRLRTRAELDDEVKTFSLGLVERWLADPSNVRLLRIGLDLWPAKDVLEEILRLLQRVTKTNEIPVCQKRVAWYCLAEIFRAGAVETGIVGDHESLPSSLVVEDYRAVLRAEAVRIFRQPDSDVPWYLLQQISLLLMATAPAAKPLPKETDNRPETALYRNVNRFLAGHYDVKSDEEFVTFAILQRRSFGDAEAFKSWMPDVITEDRLLRLAECDPAFAREVLMQHPFLAEKIPIGLRYELCAEPSNAAGDGLVPLSQVVLKAEPGMKLRSEAGLLRFSLKFLDELSRLQDPDVIPPGAVMVRFTENDYKENDVDLVTMDQVIEGTANSLYRPPSWCRPEERWRFRLGYILRFILSGEVDFTQRVWRRKVLDSFPRYRPFQSHWYQRIHGLFNEQSSFGDDWLPITEWTERFLAALLCWPGATIPRGFEWVKDDLALVSRHIEARLHRIRESNSLCVLPLSTPSLRPPEKARPMRICVLQTVIPSPGDFPDPKTCTKYDLTLSTPDLRKRHRNHLSAALEALKGMLNLRDTHSDQGRRLDWLILPELAVHPSDVESHLKKFAIKYKTIILAGLTFEEIHPGKPLINSALWIIPTWSEAHGWSTVVRRQGKAHLAPIETLYNAGGEQRIGGFRPCQWLVEYEWSMQEEPLVLTAAVCYDATDLTLASLLRDRSDIFAVPALNKDISTFDHMAQALHYHMFQMVIVANNGTFGGSSAYAPFKEVYTRQMFHLHGQPQSSMAFLELDTDRIESFVKRKNLSKYEVAEAGAGTGKKGDQWKHPPAGIK